MSDEHTVLDHVDDNHDHGPEHTVFDHLTDDTVSFLDIFSFSDSFSEVGTGVIAACVFILIVLFKLNKLADFFVMIWNFILKKTVVYSPKAILISKLAYWSEFKINKIVLKDPGRNLVFKDLLRIRFNVIKLHMFDIEETDNLEKLSRQELYTLILNCMNRTLVLFKERSKEEGLPEVVVNKFLDWHTESIEMILKSAELMVESPVYKTNLDVISAIYLLQAAMLEISIAEAEKALSTLNGALSGIKYKGIIIG